MRLDAARVRDVETPRVQIDSWVVDEVGVDWKVMKWRHVLFRERGGQDRRPKASADAASVIRSPASSIRSRLFACRRIPAHASGAISTAHVVNICARGTVAAPCHVLRVLLQIGSVIRLTVRA